MACSRVAVGFDIGDASFPSVKAGMVPLAESCDILVVIWDAVCVRWVLRAHSEI